MNRVQISTPDHGVIEFELAGLGSRMAAQIHDFCVMFLALLVLFLGLLPFTGWNWDDLEGVLGGASGSWVIALQILLLFLCVWGYHVFFECVWQGSTPGKRQMGIRVIRDDGFPVGLKESALRNLVRAADALPPPGYFVGCAVLLLDPKARRLGDMVAGTLVVRERFDEHPGAPSSAGATWAARVERGESRRAITLPNGVLSPDQIDLAEQFLSRAPGLPAEQRARIAWQIARPLVALAGEDPGAWEVRPDRAAAAENFLLQLLTRAKGPAQDTGPAEPSAPRRLF